MADKQYTTAQYTEEVKDAYEFYIVSPDGCYDLFVAELLRAEYFTLTGNDLEGEDN